MKRKPVTKDTQASVLINSRRRCSICFGLNRDTTIKQGQIAHLDNNPANNKQENLIFLCLDHHDQYDSTTRQSKNFTLEEVKKFRAELYQTITLAFDSEISFGDAKSLSPDNISGHYIKRGSFASAELILRRLSDGRYHVTGNAVWGKLGFSEPNIGSLDFISEINADEIKYKWTDDEGKGYLTVLHFTNDGIIVTEENQTIIFGYNVSFSGDYLKASHPWIETPTAPKNILTHIQPNVSKDRVKEVLGSPHRSAYEMWEYQYKDGIIQIEFRESGSAKSVALAITDETTEMGFPVPLLGQSLGQITLGDAMEDFEGEFEYRTTLRTEELLWRARIGAPGAWLHYTFGVLRALSGNLTYPTFEWDYEKKELITPPSHIQINWIGISDSMIDEMCFDWSFGVFSVE